MSIKIGIIGYGNLGRGVECTIRQNPDLELAADFNGMRSKARSAPIGVISASGARAGGL